MWWGVVFYCAEHFANYGLGLNAGTAKVANGTSQPASGPHAVTILRSVSAKLDYSGRDQHSDGRRPNQSSVDARISVSCCSCCSDDTWYRRFVRATARRIGDKR